MPDTEPASPDARQAPDVLTGIFEEASAADPESGDSEQHEDDEALPQAKLDLRALLTADSDRGDRRLGRIPGLAADAARWSGGRPGGAR